MLPILVSVAAPGMFIPDPKFSIPDPGSRIKKIPATKKSSITHKSVTMLSEIWNKIFIPDSDPDFFQFWIPDPDPGAKKAPDPGS